jgi:hypothetical protein
MPAAHDDHAGHTDLAAAMGPLPPVPTGARVFFVAPTPGMTVRGVAVDGKIELPVKMGTEGILVKPAGPVEPGAGHHHILVGGEAIPAGQIVPKDETHLHYGKGETNAVVALAPGTHKLTLQFADGLHRSYGPALSASIDVTLEAEPAAPTAPEGPEAPAGTTTKP